MLKSLVVCLFFSFREMAAATNRQGPLSSFMNLDVVSWFCFMVSGQTILTCLGNIVLFGR